MDAKPLRELAEFVQGQIVGNADVIISQALPLQDVTSGAITFVTDEKQINSLKPASCGAVIVSAPVADCDLPQLVTPDVRGSFDKILKHIRPQPADYHFQDTSASVADSATIGANVSLGHGVAVGPNAKIGAGCILHSGVNIGPDCILGENCVVYANAVVYPGSRLGNRVTLHANCVIGSHGFGYDTVDGRHYKTGQHGWVELGDDVEIGANSCVDRGTYGPTKIGEGTKIDNLVQVGHNCQLGKHNVICAHVGIAGSTSTGDYVVLAGQVGIKDHVKLGDNVTVGAQSGIMRDIESGRTVFGSPALDFADKMHQLAALAKLPEMRKTLKSLEKQMKSLQAADANTNPQTSGQTKAA